jgi:S1-C subfamily serine protease
MPLLKPLVSAGPSFSRTTTCTAMKAGSSPVRCSSLTTPPPPCRPVFLTNYHIFSSAYDASGATAKCGTSGRSFTIKLRPDLFFVSDKALDYAAVAFQNPLGKDLPFLTLATRREVVGEPVQIIGYPECEPLRYSIGEVTRQGRGNWMQRSPMACDASTLPGWSGSPVFNKQGEVIAIHHSGSTEENKGTPMAFVVEHMVAQR